MGVPKFQYTPVVADRGRRVHAVALIGVAPGASKTMCGRDWNGGWKIALTRLNCFRCKQAIFKGLS